MTSHGRTSKRTFRRAKRPQDYPGMYEPIQRATEYCACRLCGALVAPSEPGSLGRHVAWHERLDERALPADTTMRRVARAAS